MVFSIRVDIYMKTNLKLNMGKKTIRLTEAQLAEVIKQTITEAEVPVMKTEKNAIQDKTIKKAEAKPLKEEETAVVSKDAKPVTEVAEERFDIKPAVTEDVINEDVMGLISQLIEFFKNYNYDQMVSVGGEAIKVSSLLWTALSTFAGIGGLAIYSALTGKTIPKPTDPNEIAKAKVAVDNMKKTGKIGVDGK